MQNLKDDGPEPLTLPLTTSSEQDSTYSLTLATSTHCRTGTLTRLPACPALRCTARQHVQPVQPGMTTHPLSDVLDLQGASRKQAFG